MLAIISDIHSNTEALKATLDDIATRNVKQIICLGDVVGYGPEPVECVELVSKHASVTLMGNHDLAVIFEPTKFNIAAESSCFWTRQRIEEEKDDGRRNACWEFLGNLPVKYAIDGNDYDMGELVFVHGSPRRPVNEYIFPDDVYSNPSRVKGAFERFETVCFVGHTHVPGVFFDTPDFYTPDELEGALEIDSAKKVLINVGSVGQPRDRDPRAGYVLVEPGCIRFVRVEYDFNAVAEKVYAIADLDNYLGSRLKEGR